ncbi:MAG: AsmA family protein [Chlamydiales bacterium]|nr:AsmA family protein [Chlamydiales bacterium]
MTGIFVIVVVAALIIGFIGWARLPDIIANSVSKKLKVSTEIGDMGLKWSEITIDHVSIGNPPGCTLPKAFSCDEIRIMTPFSRYLDQQVVIDQISLDKVYLGLEFNSAKGTDGNWTQIMKNLDTSTGQTTKSKKEKSKSPSSDRSVLIRSLVLTNIDVDVFYRKEGGKIHRLKRIDRIELTDISSEGGLPTDQIMNSVLGQMLKSVFEKQNIQNMLQNLLQQPSDVQKYLDPFKGFFNFRYEPEQGTIEQESTDFPLGLSA